MDVSVVITTKNEEKNIESCLRSIRNVTYPQDKIEIIVVDNNSTDKTKEIVEEFKKWFTPLNVQLFNGGPERSAQRNFGIERANGKYVLYLDVDMILSESVVSECVEKCEKEGCIALYIPERIIGKGFWIKVRDFERSFYNATVIDCVRFVRRDKFLEIDGFDKTLTGPEDWDFDRRIKEIGKVSIVDSPIYHNEGEFNLKRYINKKSYYAKTFDEYINKWGKNDRTIRKQLGFCYRYFGVFMERGKWMRFFSHPVLFLSVYFLRFMLGLRYILKERG
ncbi:glycosyltransferase [bacterium]|nr:glycosyltransferase [bacterium]